jgi:putative transposase
MCRVLDVSVSGDSAWKQRAPSKRHQEDELLALRIQQVHRASHQIYGSRRIRAELAAHGQSCGRKRVVRLMPKLGFCSKPRRHRISTTDSQHSDPVAANLLNREFTAQGPNSKWVSDITRVWTAEGWLYVALVLDLFSRMIVGIAMAPHRDSELVEHAARMALHVDNPHLVCCIIQT